MTILAFNAYIGLLKDGGAREEGLANSVPYDGPLNSLPILWGAMTMGVVIVVCLAAKYVPKPNRWVALLLGFSMVSAFWSEVPKSAIGGSLLLIAAYALISMHVRTTTVDSLMRNAVIAILFIEVTCIIAIVFFPDYGVSVGVHDGEWQGVFTHKNQLGSFAVTAFCISYGDWLSGGKRISALAAVIAAILVIGSNSTTAIVILGTLVLLLSACMNRSVRRAAYRFRIPFVIVLIAMCSLVVLISVADNLGPTDEKFGTLSNRNLIWLYLIGKILLSPWVGYGLEQLSVANAANGSDFSSGVGFLVASAHNGFLELLFALGIAGFALAMTLVVSFVKGLQQDKLLPMMLGFVFLFFLENTSESRLLGLNGDFIVFLYLLEISEKIRRLNVLSPVVNDAPLRI